jgi:hypothetical protein
VQDFYDDPVGAEHETALSVLTIIGLSLSILALSLTIITFICFKQVILRGPAMTAYGSLDPDKQEIFIVILKSNCTLRRRYVMNKLVTEFRQIFSNVANVVRLV